MTEFTSNHEEKPKRSLGDVLRIHGAMLEQFAAVGQPLTLERIVYIDSGLQQTAVDLQSTHRLPTDDTAVVPSSGSEIRTLIDEDPDTAFGVKLIGHRPASEAYNNFTLLLCVKPTSLESGETMADLFARCPYYPYATKPYLHRAYALCPEFMDALYDAVSGLGGYSKWSDSILQALADPDHYEEQMNILRGSRIAYVLFVNLMRIDDLQAQARLLGGKTEAEIEDPVLELKT